MTAAFLSIFHHLFASVAEEMGVVLGRAAYSPNIKERLDFSCALFLGDCQLLAQAAHIPVHLGAMPASVRAAFARCQPFAPGDVVILNDPYSGGNHLPDITLVSPIFIPGQASEFPAFFVASRAHHADIGGMSPGSMPVSTELFQEGIIIPPLKLVAAGKRNEALWQLLLRNVRTPQEREGDLAAQLAAHTTGERRLHELVELNGLDDVIAHAQMLIEYTSRLTRAAITRMQDGEYTFQDFLDNDGHSHEVVPIQVTITVNGEEMKVDFSGTASAVRGNLNTVPAVVESAVVYCLHCAAQSLLDTALPMNQGTLQPITVYVEPGSLLDPRPPHAVSAGNVETSQRLVDVVFGALAEALPELIPAASQGTMNNISFGGVKDGCSFAYYETLAGGIGAGPQDDGADAMHSHMTNTWNTPVEALEYSFPLRIREYSLRSGSGGRGTHQGGEGLVREIQFLAEVDVTVISERRERPPYGLSGGEPGATGRNTIIRNNNTEELPGKARAKLNVGDVLRIETPGGGGWGKVA